MSEIVALGDEVVVLLNKYGADAPCVFFPALNSILKIAELLLFRSIAAEATKYVGPEGPISDMLDKPDYN
jgi:hypothetical protein